MKAQAQSCTHCPQRNSCKSVCPAVEAQLPKESTGELRRLRRSGGVNYALEFERRRAWVRLLMDWRHHLQGRSRVVFDLHFNDGLTNVEIARRLGLTVGTVSEYLSRAKAALAARIHARHTSILSEPG